MKIQHTACNHKERNGPEWNRNGTQMFNRMMGKEAQWQIDDDWRKDDDDVWYMGITFVIVQCPRKEEFHGVNCAVSSFYFLFFSSSITGFSVTVSIWKHGHRIHKTVSSLRTRTHTTEVTSWVWRLRICSKDLSGTCVFDTNTSEDSTITFRDVTNTFRSSYKYLKRLMLIAQMTAPNSPSSFQVCHLKQGILKVVVLFLN